MKENHKGHTNHTMGKYENNLKSRLTDIQADLDMDRQDRNREKQKNKEKIVFQKLPEYTKIEFWCGKCSADFVAPAYKVWIEIYGVGSWHSFCPLCGELVYRHITSKVADPYYNQSDKIKIMRGEAVKETLQPGQYGFQSQYGDPFEHYYKRFQEKHEQLTNKYAEMGLLGKTLAHKEEESSIMRELKVEY